MPSIAVLGSGGWGTAVAILLAQKPGVDVRLWSVHAETADLLRQDRINHRQLPGISIPESIELTANAEEAVAGADCWIAAIPTAFLRSALAPLRDLASPQTRILSLCKGLERHTFYRPTQILTEVLSTEVTATLSGPSHAEEVARGGPTSVVVASSDGGFANWIQHHLGGERFRIYTNTDVVGVEMAGALKNVLGIAAGICDGLQFGDNAKAALLTRGLVEMQRFGVAQGAEPATFYGLAGVGDLITTCFSAHGRNRRVGERLARGEALAEITGGPQVAEGVFTAQSVYERVRGAGIDAPIMTGVYRVLYESIPPLEVVYELLGRPQKGERIFR